MLYNEISLKYAVVTPTHKMEDKTDKTNYRPISVLPNLSKIIDSMFSKFHCGFRKGFNTQHCLLTMIEKWCKILDEGDETGAVLTDISKAFDCIDHNVLMAKLNAYGFEEKVDRVYSFLPH